MTTLIPVTELRQYRSVLQKCQPGTPVCLTENGREAYVVQRAEEFERQQAALRLLAELSTGMESAQHEPLLTVAQAFEGLVGDG